MPVFALIALVAYSISIALIVPSLLQKNSGWRRMAILSAVIALICHGFGLKERLFPGDGGQNLSLLNVGSLVSLMICTVMTIVASKNRGWLLLPIVYTFALINLAFAVFVPNEYITHLEATPGMMVHIGLSLFAYATLIIAAMYALQLAWIDYQLKNKRLAFSNEMPPLMVIERKMFHITQVGVVLLTLTLCTGLFFMQNLFSMENIDKAVLSIIAWFVYIVLLWGHYHEGWRGRRVVWFNVAGAGILTLAYFGSRILQQFTS
ncbi:inner membrane protein YpjD [Kosakonia sp. R1.Fl]|uniref:cytochrome C assembly family protein n=1 Tax=Kosakonia sp. R1.Fl TaxID=2928706 RepID=UPI00201DF314|nr:inner membrane protein YpjD [Kosakonia sp. R1.Fl]MCL6744459.1 inner membrane protein YpjD [Kosakonia sp. R1.Fl]